MPRPLAQGRNSMEPWANFITLAANLKFGNAKPVFDGPKKAFLHFPASWNSNTKSASSSHVLHIVGFFFMSELSEAQIFHAKLQNPLVLAQIFQTSCCFVQGLVSLWTPRTDMNPSPASL